MRTCVLFIAFLLTLLSLVAAIPTEISLSENETEEFGPENFNSTADDFIIPQPRYYPGNRNSKTYHIYLMDVNWFTAAEYCRHYGKALASITSLTDKQRLEQTLHKYGLNTNIRFWLGATNVGYNDQFVWVSTGEPVIFNNWHNGQPNDCRRNTCLELINEKWQVQNCNEKRKFICESQ